MRNLGPRNKSGATPDGLTHHARSPTTRFMPAAQPHGPSVAFDGVTKSYPGGTRAVDNVTLDIAPGSFVALVGSSGSGKSTLLKTVNRLIAPSAGTVANGDEDIAAVPPPEMRRRIGYVFQNVGLFPHMTVAENIAIGLRLAGVK